jgi:hypothetical protein
MTDSNYVYEKGTLFVARGGGSAPEPLAPGAANQALFADPSDPLGVAWGNGSAMGDVVGPASSVTHRLAAFNGTTGKLLEDSGILTANVVQGPASVTDNTLARYDSTTGKLLQGSLTVLSDADVLTFPANGGVVLTAGTRKGTFTFASGTHAKILTAAAVTGSIIVYTISALGTVTVAQAILTTIDTGVGFTPVSADATDTSTVSWAIVG